MGLVSSLKGGCKSSCFTGAHVEHDVAARQGAGNGVLWLV